MDAFKEKGVKFDYSPEDKTLFYTVYEEIGSEYCYIVHDRVHHYSDLPDGEFNVIYADPPWTYNVKTSYSPEKHYSVLTTEEICKLDIPLAKDAVLFLWTTNPLLEDALEVMKSWGFKYKTNIAWMKNRSGTGHYVLGQHEILLIGVKGKIGTPLPENRPSSIVNASKTKHSAKPDIIYEIIERMYPEAKYLELFARKNHDGWSSWGDEL